ncbi:rod shape-determining protein MreC [Paracidovorax anthurii]|uniref:Cell shape-determining protein MreC n=1 Tax=Paracidovorax anthurii TaxID=78229 RepID=A0A328ZLF8_9BURK|nr:rod shape-determining protein MreC [Paracidovorax anthurii]RAR86464.1 rod shape-determining protein MreC [Paracidovorax anthurii]
MPLGTLERSAPSFFKQGPSPRARLALYSALALFLMVADARLHVAEPLRKAIAVALYPVQWVMLQPVEFVGGGLAYLRTMEAAQAEVDATRRNMVQMAQRANQADQLLQENARLRKLLELRERLNTPAKAAQVIYDAADPYTRRVMIDQGQMGGVVLGSPVMDESGMLGQVTRVHPLLSEVTLLIDRDQAIPVMNVRTGARGVAYGDPVIAHGGGMELRFMPSNADVQEGDLLTTSGVDGLYPPGLPVARIVRVERRADSAFARIYCAPLAQAQGARHVLVLQPLDPGLPERPAPVEPAPARKGGRR